MSYGGCLVLTNSVLSHLATLLPKGMLKKLDFCTSSFFSRKGCNHKGKTIWLSIFFGGGGVGVGGFQNIEQGGSGNTNLEIQNECVLSRWLYKLYE